MQRDSILEKEKAYHITVRAIEGKSIFRVSEELDRFIVQMYAANIGRPGINLTKRNVKEACHDILEGKEVSMSLVSREHDPLVTLFSFALVGNHYHMGLMGHEDGAISKYLQKLNIGFVKYFNMKHQRRGSLFETRFHAVALESARQLVALIRYINIKNVIDVYQPKWKENGIASSSEALRFVRSYPYSSFPDLFGNRSSKLLLDGKGKDYLIEVLGSQLLRDNKVPELYMKDILAASGLDEGDLEERE